MARGNWPPPPRLDSLAGKKIALLDISKPGGSFFLDRLEKIFRERYRVGEVVRASKPTYTRNAPDPHPISRAGPE